MENQNKIIRLKKFQKRLAELEIDSVLLLFSRDVFYYTGTAQPCIFIITPSDYFLIVRRAFDFVLNETWLDTDKITNSGNLKEALLKLNKLGLKKGKLGIEMDVIPADQFLRIMNLFNKFELVDISNEIILQRMKKDNDEIEFIKNACKIMKKGHQKAVEIISEGITELELAAEVECAHRKAGHEGVLSIRKLDFYISRGPLASGENLFKVSGFANTITGVGCSPAIPAGPSLRKIKEGDLIIIDIPTCYRGYHCDETRTFILGDPTKEIKKMYKQLKEISDFIISSLKEGIKCNEIFKMSYEYAKRLGVEEYFLGLNPRKADFIGHGVGLDANESPILSEKFDFTLKSNFVITIEVHLTHPDYGAVKLEDMVLITKDGFELLSVTERELFIC